MKPVYLHLGCGDRKFPEFINIDLGGSGADMHLDLTKALPWQQGEVSGIYSEHFIEHISQKDAIHLLHECRRVLKPGGILRLATPDLANIVEQYNSNTVNPEWERFGMGWTANRCERLNMAVRWWGHQWMYDEEELSRLGEMVGLKVRARCQIGQSADPIFQGREHRASSTLILEFEKPDRSALARQTPLVSIVTAAYKPRYLRQALESAVRQTYRNIEILVCDDSAGTEIEEMVLSMQREDGRIRYLRNPKPNFEYARENHRLCVREAKGDFIKFLNDDDLLAPNCVERLLDCFIRNPDVTLATSKRQRIDAAGNYLADISATQAPVPQDSVLDGLAVGNALISTRLNFVGEPTTALFRKSDLEKVGPDLASIDGQKMIGIFDVAIWLNLLTRGNMVYLVEPLSFFRVHGEQIQVVSRDFCNVGSTKGWDVIRYAWERLGFLRP